MPVNSTENALNKQFPSAFVSRSLCMSGAVGGGGIGTARCHSIPMPVGQVKQLAVMSLGSFTYSIVCENPSPISPRIEVSRVSI